MVIKILLMRHIVQQSATIITHYLFEVLELMTYPNGTWSSPNDHWSDEQQSCRLYSMSTHSYCDFHCHWKIRIFHVYYEAVQNIIM